MKWFGGHGGRWTVWQWVRRWLCPGLWSQGNIWQGQQWVFYGIALEYRFFPSFFFLSGWVTNTILYPCLLVQTLAQGADSVLLEARSLCMEADLDVLDSRRLPGALLGQRAGRECPLVAIQCQWLANPAHISSKASWGPT